METIRAYAGECGAIEEEVAAPLAKQPRKEDQRDVHAELERVTYHLRLEKECRLLESQKNARAQSKVEKENEALRKQLSKKDEEILLLKQELSSPTPPRRRKVRAKKTTVDENVEMPITTMVIYNQHPDDAAAAAATLARPVKEKTPKQKAKELEDNREAAIRQAFETFKQQNSEWYEQHDEALHDVLRVFQEGRATNIGITQQYKYRLAVYLEIFLEATQVGNQHLREMLSHPFLADYRIEMMANMRQLTQEEARSGFSVLQQKNDALNPANLYVRQNLSNVTIHANFIAKAIQFAGQATELGYRPLVLESFQYNYGQEILNKWYPRLDAGNGYLVTADLKIPAVCIQSGQGRGKRCCFCGLEYIATSNGVLKHTHQVPNCDYLANYSDDEALVLEVVLQKRATYAKFAKHPFIANYDDHSLLRLATPDEIALGLYVTYQPTGEHLRLNMRVFLAMRQQVYEEFLLRIDSLDTHQDNKNLNAKPFTYQLDCFGYTPSAVAAAATNSPAKKKQQHQAKKPKKPKADTMKTRKEDGFLYKTLMDHQGGQFRKTKFHPETKETLRDFTLNPETGFGDDMYFRMPAMPAIHNVHLDEQVVQAMLAFDMPPPPKSTTPESLPPVEGITIDYYATGEAEAPHYEWPIQNSNPDEFSHLGFSADSVNYSSNSNSGLLGSFISEYEYETNEW